MITVITVCFGLLVALAITVGICDAMQASTWRRIAAERRELWESRQHVFRGVARDELAYWDNSWSNSRQISGSNMSSTAGEARP